MTTKEILIAAKRAKIAASSYSEQSINTALERMAEQLILHKDAILAANGLDVTAARDKISSVMIDRLRLTEERIAAMAEGIREIRALSSPVGKTLRTVKRPNGLVIDRICVPMGVIAIIYESRPNVTSDAAALALKSGNVCILRAGKEAYASAHAIVEAMREGLAEAGLCPDTIQLISDTTRNSATELMTARGYVDLLIPRGGAGLIRACVENATVPCLETGTGICHIFVDEDASCDMALDIIENAKTSRPSVCNALEVCLIHRNIAKEFLPRLKKRLTDDRRENPVTLIGDERVAEIIDCTPAAEGDFDTEFLDYKLAIGVVDDVEAAILHINEHSTGHSEGIITENEATAEIFTRRVDSAALYVNASTRFTDGGEFGLGCEMGISTQKLHARGPMGIEELTTYKYVVHGKGQVR